MTLRHHLALLLTLLLLACTPTTRGGLPVSAGSPLLANNTAGFVGQVRIPSALVSNNTGGLIAINGSKYRVASLAEVPLANALVYLLAPDDTFYAAPSGDHLITTTDASGSYRFDAALPSGKQVIVSAMLGGNRRMVGYTLSRDGTSRVDISLATTYVTEFLRAQAFLDNRTMADYPEALADLPSLVAETQKLLDAGVLPLPDLTVGNARAMNKTYLATLGSQSQRLSDLWAQALGHRLIAVSTVAGNYTLGSQEEPGLATQVGLNFPTGVAVDASGSLYVAVQNSHIIRKITPDGQSTVLGTFKGDGTVTTPGLSSDGTPLANLSIPLPQALACDPQGNLIVVPSANTTDTTHNNVLLFVCQVSGNHFGRAMTAGTVYWLGTDGPGGTDDPAARFQDGPVAQARFRTPTGVCADDRGDVYVADRRNNLIRRIGGDGTVSTVAGRIVTDATGPHGDQLAQWDGATNGDGGAALGAIINRPYGVAWRRVDSAHEELYVWEGNNPTATGSALVKGNAIRKISLQSSNPSGGTITTLVGGRSYGFGGDRGPASAALIKLVDPTVYDVPDGGIAISPDGRYLYFCDTRNYRIRVVDLNGGPSIDTAAGGGFVAGDAEAARAQFGDVSGLSVDASGAVYFCDAVNNVVRKINYQFGR